MSLLFILGLVLAGACAYTDVRWGLIYDAVTLPAIPIGFGANLACRGFRGLWDGIFGMTVGFLVGLVLARFRVFFGGDVKLIAAFGAITGVRSVWQATLVAIVLLGVQGLIVLLVRGAFAKVCRDLAARVLLRGAHVEGALSMTEMTMPAAPAFLLAAIIVGGGML
jgi:prepilin peptidase CpaA